MSPSAEPQHPIAYYEQGLDPLVVVLGALEAAGRSTDPIAADDLAGIDEFHALGRAATTALADLAAIEAQERVVDVGAGLGGPARYLAAQRGAVVTAVDPVARFRTACAELTRRAGLGELVSVVDGTATSLPLADGSVDVAWMQAVAISVAGKRALARELARVVRPGGRLAFFDSVDRGGELHFPLPWADEPSASFLVPADELRSAFEEAGFVATTWLEQEQALAEIGSRAFTPVVDPELVGLHQLMPDYAARMGNVGKSIGSGGMGLLLAVLERA